MHRRVAVGWVLVWVLAGSACTHAAQADRSTGPVRPSASATTAPADPAPTRPTVPPPPPRVVPLPASLRTTAETFTLTAASRILTPPGSADADRVAGFLAGMLRRSTGFALPVVHTSAPTEPGDIAFGLTGSGDLGPEGYRLTVTSQDVTVSASQAAGLFHGAQTLRQLLPPRADAPSPAAGPWQVPGVRIEDRPRFAWRGASLDVARHFFTVPEVERYIDLVAMYKLNVLHLHLSDDQGWRIAVPGWPRLTSVGARTEVGGGSGGFYTAADYRRIVDYAQDRFVTVVPEVDMPGHVNAALVAYPELSCDGRAPAPFTAIGGPPRSLCVGKPVVHRFLDDVVGALAALTPGPYLHIGGDEVQAMAPAAYAGFETLAQQTVCAHGKTPVGWQEIAGGPVAAGTVVQYWNTTRSAAQVHQAAVSGARVVLSPAAHAYLDMKYNRSTALGLSWAGYTSVQDAYSWDPVRLVPGLPDGAVLGVEAELWSETLPTLDAVEFMALPRMPALAEVGWSPAALRDWNGFRERLAAQGPRWSAMSVDYFRSPLVPWPP